MSICAKEVSARAEIWKETLIEEAFEAEILKSSLRDYAIDIRFWDNNGYEGRLTVWYSPRKKRYKPQYPQKCSDELLHRLQRSWEKIEAPTALFSEEAKGKGYSLYVDGSFQKGKIGFGWLLIHDGIKLAEAFGAVDSAFQSMRQVSGELTAVLHGLRYCREKGIEELKIHYDYEGIQAWATRRWRANLPLTAAYQRLFQNDLGMRLRWQKVSAHAGNLYNEAADALAKKGTKSADVTDALSLINQLLNKE